MIGRAIFNKTPLPPNRFSPLPMGAVRASGWLKDQLDRQVKALKKTLGTRLAGMDGESSWLGGPLDDRTTMPEALGALASIAYVSGDESLIKVLGRFVAWTMASQRDDGDFGPEGLDDWWPKIMMLRVMRIYACSTADREAFKFMDRFFRYQWQVLGDKPLTEWAVARSGENMQSALFLYNLTGQEYLLKLCELLRAQSLDWTNEMHIFPHIRATSKQLPYRPLKKARTREGALVGNDQKVNGREYHFTQAVNVAFGLKTPGIINLFKSGFKEVGAFKVGWNRLMKQHGVATSMFTGDMHLAGTSPSQGVSLDAVCETMGSLAALIGTGDEFGWEMADVLEKLAYNALPAAWSRDMAARQSVQQVNQISVDKAPRDFYNAPDTALEYRERPLGLGDQGFAQLTSSLWYATSDDGLAAIGYAPCTVSFVAGGERVRVTVEGNYPFSGVVKLRVETKNPCEFPLYLRIPGWADQVMLTLPDGELMQMRGGEIACVRRKWADEGIVTMDMPMQPRLVRWGRQSGAVELGALTMSLGLKKGGKWQYALMDGEPMKVVPEDDSVRAFKKSGRKLSVLVKAMPVSDWAQEGENCALPPVAPEVTGKDVVLTLTPYGDTDLRIAQFPVAEPTTK